MADQDFIDQYAILLIKQYWEKPKARAEIEMIASVWSELFEFFDAWNDEFDLDLATGDRLDKIGAIVDLKRTADGLAFSDEDYRFFLRLKIANNVVVGSMIDDNRTSIQDVIQFAFNGLAYVEDNYDMSLKITIGFGIPSSIIERILRLKLLPKPAAVNYGQILLTYPAALMVKKTSGSAPSMLKLSSGSALKIQYTKNFVS